MKQYISTDMITGVVSLVADERDATGYLLPGHADAVPLTVEEVRDIEGGMNKISIGYRMPNDVWHASDPTRNTWPEAVQADTRVDVRFADGGQVLDMTAGGWMWGDALHKTITHWRLSK